MTNLKSFFLKLFLGETLIEKVSSPINREISVYEDLFGKKCMRIGGISQSGELIEKVWEAALSTVHNTKHIVQSCLILGLGCGDAARLLSQKWPGCRITGIEIDPKVVEIGRKYFRLDEIPNLEVITDDAIQELKTQNSKLKTITQNSKPDLILIDLYLGMDFPGGAESKEFLQELKKMLSEDGLVIINRLYYTKAQEEEVKVFLEKVEEVFPKVKTKKAVTNLLIFCFK